MTIRTQRRTRTLGPGAPGSATDLVGRVMAEGLARRLARTGDVASRTCASGMTGTQAVARATPDVHTLRLAYAKPILRVRQTFPKVACDVRRDFGVIIRMAVTRLALTLQESVPARDETGHARILVVLGPERLHERPAGPTMAEAGFPDPEFNTVDACRLRVPAGTPQQNVRRLEKPAMAIIQSTSMTARLQVFGLEAVRGRSEQCRRESEASSPITEKPGRISGAKVEAAAPNDVPVREHGVAPDPRRPAARTGPRIRRCRA